MTQNAVASEGERENSWLLQLAAVTFVCSGAVFLFFPDQHYNEQGWGVLVKYAILAALLIALVWVVVFSAARIRTANLLLFLLWQSSLLPALFFGQDVTRVALYALPATALLIPVERAQSMSRAILPAIWVGVGAVIYEIFVLGGFARFDVQPQRYVSAFVNPNGLGVTITLLFALALALGPVTTPRRKVLLTVAVIFLVAVSQSKTGIVLLGAYVSIVALKRFPLSTIVGTAAFALALASALVFHVGGMSIASSIARLEQSATAFVAVENAILPFLGRDSATLYVDNAFLQSWIEVGVFAPILFAGCLVLAAFRDGFDVPIWSLVSLSAITTNVLYIVPAAYIVWYYIGLCPSGSRRVITLADPNAG